MRETASFFKALGDETRLKMVALLSSHEELCVCDFMEVLRVTQSKASRHLRTLFHAGLVADRREGTWSYYSLRRPDDELVRAQLEALERALASRPELEELAGELSAWHARKDRGCRAAAAGRADGRPAEGSRGGDQGAVGRGPAPA